MLNRIEEDYNKLRKKEFQFILEDGSLISLRFKKENLPHLIGIGKLEQDDETIRKFSNTKIAAKDILKRLKSEGKTYEVLKEYHSWTGHLTRRMNHFKYSNINLLVRQSVVIDFVYNPSKTKNKKAKFIFYAETNQVHLHLFIGKDENKNYYYPNSFTAEFEKDHNAGSTRKVKISKIIIQNDSDIEEIDHNYYKNIIRNVRSKIKSVNKMITNLNSAKRENNNQQQISKYEDKLHELRLDIRKDFMEINKYIPLDDFLSLKHNKKIMDYCKNLDVQYFI